MRISPLSALPALLVGASVIYLTANPVQAITPCWKALQTMDPGEGQKECARLYEEEGDSRAALYLSGIQLINGNNKSAMTWLKLAVIPTKQYPKGFKYAQYKMGKIVLYGRYGMEIDTTVAYNLFRAAADQGSAPAYYEYARMLERGIGYRPSDIADAAHHYYALLDHEDFEPARLRLTALCGNADSAYKLAAHYLTWGGRNVDTPDEDPEEAYLLLSIASHLGHDKAEERASKLSKELSEDQVQAANEQLSRWTNTDLPRKLCKGQG